MMAIALVLGALAALPYLIAGTGDFINLDDNVYVVENGVVRGGLSLPAARWALTSFHAGNWHPLTWLSHLLDVSLFGLDPRGHHLSSVFLHALSTVLLFAALARMTGAVWRSAFAAVFFGIHPLRVESVIWVSERKDVLSGLCFMLLLLAYERYVRRGGTGRYLAVVALFALGLMSKPMLVTAPFVLLLLDYWPLGRISLGRIVPGRADAPLAVLAEKVPLLVLSIASALVTFLAQHAGGMIRSLETYTLGLRVANAPVSYAAYLGKTIWPADLAVFYPYPAGIPWANLAGAGLLITAVSIAAVAKIRTRPYLVVGWCWFLVMLLPVIGVVQVGNQALADRYTYLPLIGPLIAMTWLTARMASPRGVQGVVTVAAILTLSLSALTVRQVGFWRDSELLFNRALAVTKGNWLAHNNLGAYLLERGRYQEAVGHLEKATLLVPGYPEGHNNIGYALSMLGRPEEAVVHYRVALRLRADYPAAHYNLGLVLASQQVPDEAEREFREAIRLRTDFMEAHYNRGLMLAALGQLDEAEREYRETIRLKADFEQAHTNLGVLLAGRGRFREAEASFREAARLRPDQGDLRVNLGLVLMSLGRQAEAEASFREALRLAPVSYPALAGLGRVLAAQGRREEALDFYRQALRVNPAAEETRRDLEALSAR